MQIPSTENKERERESYLDQIGKFSSRSGPRDGTAPDYALFNDFLGEANRNNSALSLFLTLSLLLAACGGVPNPVMVEPGAPSIGITAEDAQDLLSEGWEFWSSKHQDKLQTGLTEADCAVILQLQLNASTIVSIEKEGNVVTKVIIKIPRDKKGKALIGQFIEDFEALCGQYYKISVNMGNGTVTITKKK